MKNIIEKEIDHTMTIYLLIYNSCEIFDNDL